MLKVKKAVIPAAGLGTRFLPATKTVPKELLPVVDRPTLLYVVEEAVNSGIEDIIIVAGRGKSAIEDFFDTSYELEDTLEKAGKIEALNSLQKIRSMANVISVRQKYAGGLGHAVLTAKSVVGNEPFAVLLGDEITLPSNNSAPVTQVLIQLYCDTELSFVNVMDVSREDTQKYGIIRFRSEEKTHGLPTFVVDSVIEKPQPEQAPSTLALPGRYIFAPEIFKHLQSIRPGKNGELQLTDAMTRLAQSEGLRAATVPCRRFDTGDRLGFLKANIELALERPDLGPQLKNYLQNLGSRND